MNRSNARQAISCCERTVKQFAVRQSRTEVVTLYAHFSIHQYGGASVLVNGAVFKTVSETARAGSGRFDSYTPPPIPSSLDDTVKTRLILLFRTNVRMDWSAGVVAS